MNLNSDIILVEPHSKPPVNPPEKFKLKYSNFGLDLTKEKVLKKGKMIHPDLPKVPFVITTSGPRDSGKSQLQKHMMKSKDFYNGIFDYIVFLGNSLDVNDDYAEWEEDGERIFKFSNPRQFDSVIQELIQTQTDLIKSVGKKRTPHILIVGDDILDSDLLNRSRNSGASKVASRGRHVNISVCFLVQKLSAVPRGIRINSDMMILFAPFDYSETEQYLEKFCSRDDKKKMRNLIYELFDQEHKFLVINNNERRISRKIRSLFSDILNVRGVPNESVIDD